MEKFLNAPDDSEIERKWLFDFYRAYPKGVQLKTLKNP